MRRPGQPGVQLVVNGWVCEEVEVVQSADVAAALDLERDVSPTPAARGARELHQQVAECVGRRVPAVAGEGHTDKVVRRVLEERDVGAPVTQELVGIVIAPVLFDA